MEKIKALIHSLKEQNDNNEVVSILQQINDLIITEYMIELKNGVRMYPIEVEAYFYERNVFADPYTHKNELQKNHFGKLYFHRWGGLKNGTFKSKNNTNRGGVDICLSDEDGFYLGILIRASKFRFAELKIGTRKVLDQLISCFDLKTEVEKEDKLIELEEESSLKRAIEDPRKHAPIRLPLIGLPATVHLPRVGLNEKDNSSKKYLDYDLRSLIEFNENTYVGGQKKVVKKYFDDHASLGKEAAKRVAKELFDVVPNWLNKYIDEELYTIEEKQI